jgi:hypothetical protein
VQGILYSNKLKINKKMEKLTQEQIEKSISAAFDSVNLLNELNLLESLDEEQTDRKTRNIQHLKTMIEKEWFSTNLTSEQASKINAVIE